MTNGGLLSQYFLLALQVFTGCHKLRSKCASACHFEGRTDWSHTP